MTRLESALAELADALREEVRAELRDVAGAPERLYDVRTAAQLCSIGRTRLYAEIASGRVRSVRVGRRRLIPSSAIRELAQSPPGAGE